MFLKYTKVKVDYNFVLTACLLCNCKKIDDSQKMGKLQSYAKDGAEHLAKLGFDEKFCRTCEGVNRYSVIESRELESDILELVDIFGGMLIDRSERTGFNPDEAMVLVEHRNLKGKYNRYVEIFRDFVIAMEKIEIHGVVKTTVFARLQKIMRESKNITIFAKRIALEYSPLVNKKLDELDGIETPTIKKSNRALFSAESEERILNSIKQ